MGRKITVWTFQTTNKRNLIRENLDITKKRESILIAAQNNVIRTDYVKVRIEKKQ